MIPFFANPLGWRASAAFFYTNAAASFPWGQGAFPLPLLLFDPKGETYFACLKFGEGGK